MQVFSSNVKLLCLKMHGGIMQVSKQQFASEIPDMREFLFCEDHVCCKSLVRPRCGKFHTHFFNPFFSNPTLKLNLINMKEKLVV